MLNRFLRSPSRTAILATLACCAALAAPAAAQTYRPVDNQDARVKFRVHKKLTQSPEEFGFEGGARIAKFQPQGDGDFMFGRFGTAQWYLHLYYFKKKPDGPTTGEEADANGDGAVTEAEEAIHQLTKEHKSWKDFITKGRDAKSRTFKVQDKKKRGGRNKPDYRLWEYVEPSGYSDMEYHTFAAAYDLGDREVVLECQLAADKGRPASAKFRRIAVAMLTSLEELSEDELTGGPAADKERDKHADTVERKKRLLKAKENIQGLDNWDYFTTPNYIVLYSWDGNKPEKQLKQLKFAQWISSSLEALRAEYERLLPPHDKMGAVYPVIRVCKDYSEYRNYDAPAGSAGYFHPATKEFVVFDDTDGWMGGDKGTRSVLFHEGWHQYSDSYFDGPEMHRWWDEGIADYFQAYTEGAGGWKWKPVRDNKTALMNRIRADEVIPLPQLCSWERSRFYGQGAFGNYAQAYALAALVIRGKSTLGRAYKPEWEGILHRYADELKKTGDKKKANKAAFKGVDMDELEQAWLAYIKGAL